MRSRTAARVLATALCCGGVLLLGGGASRVGWVAGPTRRHADRFRRPVDGPARAALLVARRWAVQPATAPATTAATTSSTTAATTSSTTAATTTATTTATSSAATSPGPSPPELSVSAAALYAPDTGQLLYGVSPDREVAIASTTKLMTALITVEHDHHLSTTFTQND